ncbi:helix-hairpin-helix domain-containing protein [Brachybacterium sp. DNPG3]
MRAASRTRRSRPSARGGRHQRSAEAVEIPEAAETAERVQDPGPLLEQRDRTAAPRRRRRFPAPSPSSLVGVGVLVLIGIGVVHLSGSGSAVPLEEPSATVVLESPTDADDLAGAGPAEAGTESASSASSASATAGASDLPTTSAESSGSAESAGSAGSAEIVVHVSGQVTAPGVVRLPAGSRVDDAVRAAGGATDEADLGALNLARILEDGEQVRVPAPGEELPAPTATPSSTGAGGTSSAAGEGAAADGTGALIDLNTASAAQLEGLPGVGPAIAQRIVDHREANGPFASVDDLLEVSGIGTAKLEQIRPAATVG